MRCTRTVRLLVIVVGSLVGLTAPAVACPPRDKCMVQLKSTVGDLAEKPAPKSTEPTTLSMRTSPRPEPGQVEMPWIWRALREQVYSRMPTYEQRGTSDTGLKVVLAPVVVTSPTDTVPGLGIAGDF